MRIGTFPDADAAIVGDATDMVRHSELIVGRGSLTPEADLPVPCSDPEFVLSLQLDDGTLTEQMKFRAFAAGWSWSANGVEWIHRTDASLHFGGASVIDALWPCRYRATARISEIGEVVHIELRLYAMAPTSGDASPTPFVVLRTVALGAAIESGDLHPVPEA